VKSVSITVREFHPKITICISKEEELPFRWRSRIVQQFCVFAIEILVLEGACWKKGEFFSAGLQPILCCKERFCWSL
jgi:hypothetical protein